MVARFLSSKIENNLVLDSVPKNCYTVFNVAIVDRRCLLAEMTLYVQQYVLRTPGVDIAGYELSLLMKQPPGVHSRYY
jgi:hypothetical protein